MIIKVIILKKLTVRTVKSCFSEVCMFPLSHMTIKIIRGPGHGSLDFYFVNNKTLINKYLYKNSIKTATITAILDEQYDEYHENTMLSCLCKCLNDEYTVQSQITYTHKPNLFNINHYFST